MLAYRQNKYLVKEKPAFDFFLLQALLFLEQENKLEHNCKWRLNYFGNIAEADLRKQSSSIYFFKTGLLSMAEFHEMRQLVIKKVLSAMASKARTTNLNTIG